MENEEERGKSLSANDEVAAAAEAHGEAGAAAEVAQGHFGAGLLALTSFSGSFPHRISHTAEAGICTDPNHKLAAHNAKSNRTRTTISRCSCCLFGLSFIRITVDSSGIDNRGTGRGGTMQRVPVTTGRDETESLRSSCIGTSRNRISFSPGRL